MDLSIIASSVTWDDERQVYTERMSHLTVEEEAAQAIDHRRMHRVGQPMYRAHPPGEELGWHQETTTLQLHAPVHGRYLSLSAGESEDGDDAGGSPSFSA